MRHHAEFVLRPLSVLVLSLALSFVVPALCGTALAQLEEGVHVDPDSAPAKEYALPLQDARVAGADTSARGATGGGAAAAPAAFGSGITQSAAPTDAARARSGVEAGSAARRSASGRGVEAEDRSASGAERARHAARPAPVAIGETSSVAALYSVGGAGVVLIAGALLALTLRRRQPSA